MAKEADNNAFLERRLEAEFPVESFRVSKNLTITGILLEHEPETLSALKDKYQALISAKDGLICEYDPEALSKMKDNPLVTYSPFVNFPQIFNYFSSIREMGQKAGKDIWNFDPAKSENFALIRGPQYSLFAASVGGVLLGLILDEKKLTRKEFGLRLSVASLGLAVLCTSPLIYEKLLSQPNPLFLDAEFRRITVASGIKQLANKFDSELRTPQDLLFITAPAHWRGIRGWLEGDNLGFYWNNLLSSTSFLDERVRQEFFTGCRYRYTGKNPPYEAIEFPLKEL